MIKELFARLVLVLFIIGLSTEAESGSSGAAKQLRSVQPSNPADIL